MQADYSESHEYNFFDADLSAGVLTAVDPFISNDVKNNPFEFSNGKICW